ncbi:MAG: saccharopine dehydrogenase NADP-binding domain-containing protein [Halioglobus sp.]|nr:saccharopine dehydrogenase NADP-binding domain-containing protein [Halioglobus sp.]
MAEREFDIIVWGASGFTGQLVAEYLAATYGVDGDLRWAMAGRNEAKLKDVLRTVAPGAKDSLPLVIADSADRASLDAMVARANVICTTVGPYAKYGTPLVEACIEAGTDYCDLTGEVQWMARIIPEYQAAAEDSGARIVHTCGFDSVPFDMGAWHLQQLMHEKHGVYAKHIKGRVVGSRGGASGGTIASMLNMMDEAKSDSGLMKRVADPYVLYPEGVATGPDKPDQRGAVYDETFGQWTSPFIMAAINTRVVRRTNALLGLPWGQDFRYDEAILNRSRTQASLVSMGMGAGMLTMALGPTRKLAQRFLPQPGEGPDAGTRESGYYELLFHGIHPSDPGCDMRLRVYGDMDPGYGSTSRMLGEAAACLAVDKAITGGGFWTPASALGQAYLQRLQDSAGLTFEPVAIPG